MLEWCFKTLPGLIKWQCGSRGIEQGTISDVTLTYSGNKTTVKLKDWESRMHALHPACWISSVCSGHTAADWKYWAQGLHTLRYWASPVTCWPLNWAMENRMITWVHSHTTEVSKNLKSNHCTSLIVYHHVRWNWDGSSKLQWQNPRDWVPE